MYIVYAMLLVSLDCPFSIAPSVSSNVYSLDNIFNNRMLSYLWSSYKKKSLKIPKR